MAFSAICATALIGAHAPPSPRYSLASAKAPGRSGRQGEGPQPQGLNAVATTPPGGQPRTRAREPRDSLGRRPPRAAPGRHGLHVPHLARAARVGLPRRLDAVRQGARPHPHVGPRAPLRARSPRSHEASVEIVDEAWKPSVEPETAPFPRSAGGETLNPKYTFGQFVIGDGNRLAHAAALAVAEMPAQAYNPLFIYGAPGLGKTHLLQAIGNYVQLYGSGLRVRYSTVEDFTGEFVRSLRAGDTSGFRERFRGADVLLVDDVQFLADKVKTKEEFFHTFNALYESGRQLVLTSDRAPSDHDEFEARLRERFASGLVADLQPPELDVRLAILRKRARFDSLHEVSDETLLEIASRVTATVRSLERALI